MSQGQTSFAEEAMRLGGKSEDEAQRMGAVDRADDQVDRLFAAKYQTANSPIHRAIWDGKAPLELFTPEPPASDPAVDLVMDRSLKVAKDHKAKGTLFGANGKVSDAVLRDLGEAGYWGLLIDKKHGGAGASFARFAPFLGKMAMVDPSLAALGSVHGCIGAVDPLEAFGSAEQKARLLPLLASGERISAFALTEPGAGSDLTALHTRAVRIGDHFEVTGEKLFITNAAPGRLIGLVCLLDKKPAVLIADLPKTEDDTFQIVHYGLHAVKRLHNVGLRFTNYRVPAENLLAPATGDGLTIAYHGLNLGRLALCSAASATMKIMLANMLPWMGYRKTYGQPIQNRELVQRRIATLAGFIVGADALVAWGSWLIDQGYRCELEGVLAKIFGSEAQKEAAIELFMKTHGGRSFLHGHLLGDNVHEFLAPCIYEGEGEMLGLAFFKSLAKHHGQAYFEPIGKALHAAGIKNFNAANPAHAWKLRREMWSYSKWYLSRKALRKDAGRVDGVPAPLAGHLDFARETCQRMAEELSGAMRKHQLKLADRQCRMADLSQRVQDSITMIVTVMGGKGKAETSVLAADMLCRRLKSRLTGARPADRDFRDMARLADAIKDGAFVEIAGIEPDEIMMKYGS